MATIREFLVPFEEMEIVWIGYKARVIASSKKEAFSKVREIINTGKSPHCYADEVEKTFENGKTTVQYDIESTLYEEIIEHVASEEKFNMDDYTPDDVDEVDERLHCEVSLSAFDIARYSKDKLYNMAEEKFSSAHINISIFEMDMIPVGINEHFVTYKCIPQDYKIHNKK